jgi:hypothetical protein
VWSTGERLLHFRLLPSLGEVGVGADRLSDLSSAISRWTSRSLLVSNSQP